MSQTVAVVDDDDVMRQAMVDVLQSVGIEALAYENAQKFLAADGFESLGCVVMDIRMPGLSGMQAQKQLNENNVNLPLIFVTGHGDVEMAVEAMKCGAKDFITKPFRDQSLIDAVQSALNDKSTPNEDNPQSSQEHHKLLEQLTGRERQVLSLVVQGKRSKQIAAELCIAVKTVEEHRSRLLSKMQVHSSTELVGLAASLGFSANTPG